LIEYERLIDDKKSRLAELNSKISGIEEDLYNLHKNFPTLKQAITEWMEYQQTESEDTE
jgi:SMC interacting uncharacterized protein involved in chromosome segregation